MSANATEFAQRELVVAYGNCSMTGLATIVSSNLSHGALKSFTLFQCPMIDYIFNISHLTSTKYRTWTISTDVAEYRTQDDVPGSYLTCELAKRPGKKQSAAVMECFPSERKKTFLSVLHSLK